MPSPADSDPIMSRFVRGDVMLAPVPLAGQREAKVRPVVVMDTAEKGILIVCPVSSKIPGPADTGCIPIELCDFACGGLDLFEKSYVLTSAPCPVRVGDVVGKKGRLSGECMENLISAVRSVQGFLQE
jgi:hypothetical protein